MSQTTISISREGRNQGAASRRLVSDAVGEKLLRTFTAGSKHILIVNMPPKATEESLLKHSLSGIFDITLTGSEITVISNPGNTQECE